MTNCKQCHYYKNPIKLLKYPNTLEPNNSWRICGKYNTINAESKAYHCRHYAPFIDPLQIKRKNIFLKRKAK